MFNNVGRKISTISKFIFYLISTLLIIATLIIMIADKAIIVRDFGGIYQIMSIW